ncbi:hypothetical protein ALC57_14052 [Trachymyrmex cornetzi]|uniref:Uncharacterized protein n=1 Tax=Trachymyrmex cornetzi TaxID=471704 RepID=A0A151IYX9_9HYME|nr:hypothetical protein ALC57_14052 [Trachymyrmex cornetzi]
MKTDETYRKTEVLFCIDTKRFCTGDDSQCSVARMLRQRFGDFDTDNDATPDGYPVGEFIYKCKRTEEYIAATSVKVQLFAECLYEPGAAVRIAPREKT